MATDLNVSSRNGPSPAERETKNLEFELLRNALYHMDEARFYIGLERMIMYVSTISGTAVVGAAYTTYPSVAYTLGFVVAALSTASIAFGITDRARQHESFRQQYYGMLSAIQGETPSKKTISRIRAEMTRMWGTEPHIKWAINALATNAALWAMTKDNEVRQKNFIPVSRAQRLLRFVRRYRAEDFPPLGVVS